jgi:putative DNA primase/helicase
MNLDRVLEQMRSRGLRVTEIEAFGKIVHVPVDFPKPNRGTKKSGWYVIYEVPLRDGRMAYAGVYENFKDAEGPVKLSFKPRDMDPEDEANYWKRQAEAKRHREEAEAAKAEQAARRAQAIWDNLPDSGASQYLARKGVKPFGVKFAKGKVVIPLQREGRLVGLQFIGPDGDKKFLTGTPKKGSYHLIGSMDSVGSVAICEGYATGASVHMALGIPVAVAFDAGNLLPVAMSIKKTFSPSLIIVAGDNDAGTPGNPGLTKAGEAALKVGGVVVVPDFGEVSDGN